MEKPGNFLGSTMKYISIFISYGPYSFHSVPLYSVYPKSLSTILLATSSCLHTAVQFHDQWLSHLIMKFISGVLFLAATIAALPGQGDNGWGGNWNQGGRGGNWNQGGWGGGYETCSTEYITRTSVHFAPTTEYKAKTTYVPYTTQARSQIFKTSLITKKIVKTYTTQAMSETVKTSLITTAIVKTYTTTIISTYTSVSTEVITSTSTKATTTISTYTSVETEVNTSTSTKETWVPVTSSVAVVTTHLIATSAPFTSSSVETQTICCTQYNHGSQGPWYTKKNSGGW